MTALGGRPVQAVTPPEDVAKREAARAPAAKTPEMTMPLPNARTVKPTTSPSVKQAPDEARGRTPTKGKEPAFGSAIADTGVRGQGFGLSTGGGAGTGSTLEITGDFCCPEYLATMVARIRSAWNQNQGARGTSLIRFTIQRDGRITDATIFQTSGTTTLDTAAWRAVLATKTLPPLPDAFTNPTLTLRLSFEYQ
jgi:protein TonB